MAGLIVKLDQVAAIRATKNQPYPGPVAAAVLADLAGADGIAIHLREDLRTTQQKDVQILRQAVQKKFILEMAPTPEMVAFSLGLKPDLVTLVPETTKTSVGKEGMDLVLHKDKIAEAVQTLHGNRIAVCILIDPDPDQVKLAHQANADRVELCAEVFCRTIKTNKGKRARSEISDTAKFARKLKMAVDAGRGLDYSTILGFKGLRQIETFIIGYSIISRAILTGMETATREMAAQIRAL